MSFDAYIPCNCRKENKMKFPEFIDKLKIIDGLIDLKPEYVKEFETEFDSWKFCKHNQVALEISMVQSISNWKTFVIEKYPNKFPNFEIFIPQFNNKTDHNYSMKQAVIEIRELNILEGFKYKERFDQFIKLLNTALELGQKIYW